MGNALNTSVAPGRRGKNARPTFPRYAAILAASSPLLPITSLRVLKTVSLLPSDYAVGCVYHVWVSS